MNQIIIKDISPFDESVTPLIEELDALQESLYPPESNHLDPIETLAKDNVKFLAAYLDDKICGIGAMKLMDGYGEVKRVFVPTWARGQGVAHKIMEVLENFLLEKGIYESRLETGNKQESAILFYKKIGYAEIKPFGDYKEDPLSLFLGKSL